MVYPALPFWAVTNVNYINVADFETKLRQIMLKAGLDIDHCTPVKSRKKTGTLDAYTATLCQVIKDHKWAYAIGLMEKSFHRLSEISKRGLGRNSKSNWLICGPFKVLLDLKKIYWTANPLLLYG